MNKSFDIKRFCRLVWHDVRSCPKEYIISGLSLALTFSPLMVLSQQLLGNDYTHGTFYRLVLMIGTVTWWALMVPSNVYPNMGNKKRGIYFAMLPATKAEKHASIATVMVLMAVVLTAIGLTVDVLLTAVHLPGYTKYFWQSQTFQLIDLPMVVGSVFAFLGPAFGMIWANTLTKNNLRLAMIVLMFLWMIGMLYAPPLFFDGKPQAYWIVIAVEVAVTLFLVWLSRWRMDHMTY